VIALAREEKRNALSTELVEKLAEEIARAGRDPSARGVVLTARGDVFAAGGDLDEFARMMDADDAAEHVLALGRTLQIIERIDVPVLAAVSGDVFGGGCELTLLCDLIVAEEQARFGFRHAAMGLSPAWGGGARLVERVGSPSAARLLFASETIGADEAKRIGLVAEVTPRGRSVEHAVAYVERVARNDRAAVAAQKRLLAELHRTMRGDAEQREAEAFRRLWAGPAHRAAMGRFLARQKPGP
jgi:enoyl-CoA hydratase